MRRIVNYALITGNADGFAQEVAKHLNDGYELYGAMTTVQTGLGTRFSREMVKYEVEDTNAKE